MERFETEDLLRPILRIFDGPEEELTPEEAIALEEELEEIRHQARVEEFWAGRNRGARRSARFAA